MVECDRNLLTSHAGDVTRYVHDTDALRLTLATSAGTVEQVEVALPVEGTLRYLLMEGQPFTAADWQRLEAEGGRLRQETGAIAWICSGGGTWVDFRPGVRFTGAE